MSAVDAPGWFGKLSVLGDFASRRLSPAWVAACDDWLSRGMQAGAQQLGSRWLSHYLAAPVMRFAWAPGLIDEHWWFGVLMPSCDNVGRYFPLVVAQARPVPPTDPIALDHLERWWAHLSQCALHTLAEGATLEGFEQALRQAPPWPGAGPTIQAARPMACAGEDRWSLPADTALVQLMCRLAADGLAQHLAGRSLWWPLPASGQSGACSVIRGLPTAAAFAGLLAGSG